MTEAEIMADPPNIAGLQRAPEPSVSPGGRRPLSMDWITDDLLRATLAAWSPRYEQPLTSDDAVEILMNVKRFSEALLASRKDQT
jgi:hypothetical protein